MSDGTVCVYCKGTIEAGAVKCRSCGEWVDGRWRLSGAGKIVLALIAVELFGMAALFGGWVPAMKSMLEDMGGTPPWFTRVVLSWWWLPAWTGVVISLTASSLAIAYRMRARLTLLACALVIGLIAVIMTMWGLWLPIFNLAGAIKA